MKLSELKGVKLSDEDVYDIMMSGIEDISKESPDPDNLPDYVVVLGARPADLRDRLLKLANLYDKGYCKSIIVSGGEGWQRLITPDDDKLDKNKRKDLGKYIKSLRTNLIDALETFRIMFSKEYNSHIPNGSKGLYSYKQAIKNGSISSKSKRLNEKYLSLTEAELAYHFLEDKKEGIEDIILLEKASTNTSENARFVKDKIEEKEAEVTRERPRRIMIVTSCYHARRSMLTFKKNFPEDEITVCPSTYSLKKQRLSLSKESLMKNKMPLFRSQLKSTIEYIEKGDVYDPDLAELVGKEKASEIEKKAKEQRELEI